MPFYPMACTACGCCLSRYMVRTDWCMYHVICTGSLTVSVTRRYPVDVVVCTALGADMYDSVYPTRTGRFGVALVSGVAGGVLRLRSGKFAGARCAHHRLCLFVGQLP